RPPKGWVGKDKSQRTLRNGWFFAVIGFCIFQIYIIHFLMRNQLKNIPAMVKHSLVFKMQVGENQGSCMQVNRSVAILEFHKVGIMFTNCFKRAQNFEIFLGTVLKIEIAPCKPLLIFSDKIRDFRPSVFIGYTRKNCFSTLFINRSKIFTYAWRA